MRLDERWYEYEWECDDEVECQSCEEGVFEKYHFGLKRRLCSDIIMCYGCVSKIGKRVSDEELVLARNAESANEKGIGVMKIVQVNNKKRKKRKGRK